MQPALEHPSSGQISHVFKSPRLLSQPPEASCCMPRIVAGRYPLQGAEVALTPTI